MTPPWNPDEMATPHNAEPTRQKQHRNHKQHRNQKQDRNRSRGGRPGLRAGAAATLTAAVVIAIVMLNAGPSLASGDNRTQRIDGGKPEQAANLTRTTASTTEPCRSSDVSYFFGPLVPDGLNALHVSVTLTAHAGVHCHLSDIPQFQFEPAAKQTGKLVVSSYGLNQQITLDDTDPLNTVVSFHNPLSDRSYDIQSFKLDMPAGGPNVYPYGFAGTGRDITVDNTVGVLLYPWSSGVGEGQGIPTD